MLVVVPDYVRDDINRILDAALVECPEAAGNREVLYGQLLAYFDDNGNLPDFSIQRRDVSED